MRSEGRLLLIDWDTVGLALPERDLWLAAGDDARAAGRYADLTGRRVSGAAMDLYRLRWVLDDIALSVRDFRARHERNEDTALMWDAITEHIGEIG
jgi:spectinomycin phosphotransferase